MTATSTKKTEKLSNSTTKLMKKRRSLKDKNKKNARWLREINKQIFKIARGGMKTTNTREISKTIEKNKRM